MEEQAYASLDLGPCRIGVQGVHIHPDVVRDLRACDRSSGILTLLEWVTGYGRACQAVSMDLYEALRDSRLSSLIP